MIGGISPQGAECCLRGNEEIMVKTGGGGDKVGVRKFSSRGARDADLKTIICGPP